MPTDVETLIEMGFPENRAKRALAATHYKSVQLAMDWLFAHSDDPDIDEPFEVPEGHRLGEEAKQDTGEGGDGQTETIHDQSVADAPAQAKSLKCDECGKRLRRPEDVEMHAVRTGHGNFSESTEEIKPLTPEEKQEQMLRLQEKMKERQKEKAEQAKQEAINREKLRRKQGKELVEVKQKKEMEEIKKLAEQKKREKMEERLARERVKEEIERDKRDRAARFAKTSSQEPTESADTKPSTAAPTTTATTAPKKDYDSTRLQMRLPNGSALTNTFGVSEPLAAVRLYIQVNRKDGPSDVPFSLMTSFPKKVFTEDDMEKPLKELGLVPSAVLMVTKPTS